MPGAWLATSNLAAEDTRNTGRGAYGSGAVRGCSTQTRQAFMRPTNAARPEIESMSVMGNLHSCRAAFSRFKPKNRSRSSIQNHRDLGHALTRRPDETAGAPATRPRPAFVANKSNDRLRGSLIFFQDRLRNLSSAVKIEPVFQRMTNVTFDPLALGNGGGTAATEVRGRLAAEVPIV
jgi:hypothetical protein